jgi:hypothetical protein
VARAAAVDSGGAADGMLLLTAKIAVSAGFVLAVTAAVERRRSPSPTPRTSCTCCACRAWARAAPP